jgi:6-bladed beta-propeller
MNSVARQTGLLFLWLLSFVLTGDARDVARSELPRSRATDLKTDFATDEKGMFARPVHLAFQDGRLSVVDAEEAAVSVFDPEGRFIIRAGGKGQGPGQLDFPTAAWPVTDGLIVSDGRNQRIVRFDARGRERDSFRLGFFPETIVPLAGDRILVARNAGAGDEEGRILNCYDLRGRPLWSALPSARSGDRVADTMSNVVILLGAPSGEIFAVFRYRAEGIRRFSATGRDLGEIRPGRAYPVGRIRRTIPPGKTVQAEVFCWHAAYSEGCFYLLAAVRMDGGDLGPGSDVYVIGFDGRIQEVIELPGTMTKIAASAERLYALDLDYRLRVLKVEKK